MEFEEPREAVTPAEMRAEIFRLRYNNATIHNVMTAADHQGLSAEDRYTMLAYYALKQGIHYQNTALQFINLTPSSFLAKVPD